MAGFCPGSYTIGLTATDKDGVRSTPFTLPVAMRVTEKQGDILAVGGGAGTDSLTANATAGPDICTITSTSIAIRNVTVSGQADLGPNFGGRASTK